jgi:CRP-like cAMP-binding protein
MKLFTQDNKVESLKRAPLFAGLSRKELAQIARLADDVEVPAGTVLCTEGDPGREFFVLMEGKVDVARKGRRVATLGAGWSRRLVPPPSRRRRRCASSC